MGILKDQQSGILFLEKVYGDACVIHGGDNEHMKSLFTNLALRCGPQNGKESIYFWKDTISIRMSNYYSWSSFGPSKP